MPRRIDETPVRGRSSVIRPEASPGTPPRPPDAGIIGRSLAWMARQFDFRGTSQTPNQLDLRKIVPVLEIERPPLVLITFPNPAAAAVAVRCRLPDIFEWELVGMTFVLTADANPANRLVSVNVDWTGSGAIYHNIAAGAFQTAGRIGTYVYAPGIGPTGDVTPAGAGFDVFMLPAPVGMRFPPSTVIEIDIENAQAGDQVSAIVVAMRRQGSGGALRLVGTTGAIVFP